MKNSFAALTEFKVSYEFFGLFLNMAGFSFLVAKDHDGIVLGIRIAAPP